MTGVSRNERKHTMIKGFKEFILRGNVIDLAVAVVIGAAFTAVVNAIVSSIINPLIALVWPRLALFACKGLPRRRWSAVIISLLAGAATHLAWDALTHSDDPTLSGPNWAQHASTIAGTIILAWWGWRKARAAPKPPPGTGLPVFFRVCVALAMLGAMTVAALWSADGHLAFELSALRHFLRTAGLGALHGLALALLVYCALFQRKMP